jgi:hypothetical protein
MHGQYQFGPEAEIGPAAAPECWRGASASAGTNWMHEGRIDDVAGIL